MKNQANAWTAKDCPLFAKCRFADSCPWKTMDGRIVCASGMYEIPDTAPQTDSHTKPHYPSEVFMPDGSIMTITDREAHLKALRAWGCHSELFTAVTREEAERIASEELAEIAAQTEKGVELTRSWVRFSPSMNHTGGKQMKGFFYATRETAGIGGNFPNGGTRTLRERLSEALLKALFLRAEIDKMLNDPENEGYCIEAIDAARKRRMKARPMPADEEREARAATAPAIRIEGAVNVAGIDGLYENAAIIAANTTVLAKKKKDREKVGMECGKDTPHSANPETVKALARVDARLKADKDAGRKPNLAHACRMVCDGFDLAGKRRFPPLTHVNSNQRIKPDSLERMWRERHPKSAADGETADLADATDRA